MKIGDKVIVPCFIYNECYSNIQLTQPIIIPVYDNFHDDKESGQDYKHYHVDTRFIDYRTFPEIECEYMNFDLVHYSGEYGTEVKRIPIRINKDVPLSNKELVVYRSLI